MRSSISMSFRIRQSQYSVYSKTIAVIKIVRMRVCTFVRFLSKAGAIKYYTECALLYELKRIRQICSYTSMPDSDSVLYKNLAIANRSRFSCAHNTLRASLWLNVTQGHWKWNHWIDHTRLSSSPVI